jgi:hypothetical protein
MLSAALFSVAASAASVPRAGELLPHRATYVLSLGHNLSGSDVVNVRGVMAYEFADACNGWTFWHYREKGGLAPIDELRRVARSKLAAV